MRARDDDFFVYYLIPKLRIIFILDSQPERRAQSNEHERGKDSLERGYFYLERCGWHLGESQ